MATGRTLTRHTRVYIDGNGTLNASATNIGPLATSWEEYETAGLDWTVKGSMLGGVTFSAGVLNTMMEDTATTGSHPHGSLGNGLAHNVMVPIGIRAAPAEGDPVFCGRFLQNDYMVTPSTSGVVAATWRFGGWDYAQSMNYGRAWGVLLAPYASRTAVNNSAGVDGGASTSLGGWMMYQCGSITGASGNVVIKVQDSANNSTWADLASATVTLQYNAEPASGIVQLATNATVRQYLRWQIVLTTVTEVSFALAFVRGNGV
jgi:hypothetical protein